MHPVKHLWFHLRSNSGKNLRYCPDGSQHNLLAYMPVRRGCGYENAPNKFLSALEKQLCDLQFLFQEYGLAPPSDMLLPERTYEILEVMIASKRRFYMIEKSPMVIQYQGPVGELKFTKKVL